MSLPADIPPAERHFIELATRPLENHPDVRDEARGELMERLSRQDPSQREAMAEAALTRLAKQQPGSWRGKAIGIGVAWLIMAGVAAWLGFGFYREIQAGREGVFKSDRYASSLRPASSEPPQDPAELEAYLENRAGAALTPTEFHAAWTKLDPDNGMWLLQESREKFRSWYRNPSRSGPQFDADLETAWKLVEQAVAAPRFEYYLPKRNAREIAALGDPETCIALGQRVDLSFQRSFRNTEDEIFTKLVEAKARTFLKANDSAGLLAMIRVWEKLCLRIAEQSLHREDLMHVSGLEPAGDYLRVAAWSLEMEAEARRLLPLTTAITHSGLVTPSASYRPEMGRIARRLYFQKPFPASEAYKPGRMMEYAAAERFLSLIAAGMLLLILAVVGIESVRRERRINGLASGLSPLFDGRDGLWLIGLGLVAPLTWYWGITRLSPLGHRDVGLLAFKYPAILVQAAATLLLGLSLMIQTAQWRVGVRTKLIGLKPRHAWVGWLVAGMTAALVPAAGIGRWLPYRQIDKFFMVMAASCGISLLWILWRGGALLFGPNSNALPGVLAARAASLPLVLAIAMLLALNPLLLVIEKNWMAQDSVTGWDANRGCTLQEARSVDAAVARCRELFEKPEKQ